LTLRAAEKSSYEEGSRKGGWLSRWTVVDEGRGGGGNSPKWGFEQRREDCVVATLVWLQGKKAGEDPKEGRRACVASSGFSGSRKERKNGDDQGRKGGLRGVQKLHQNRILRPSIGGGSSYSGRVTARKER